MSTYVLTHLNSVYRLSNALNVKIASLIRTRRVLRKEFLLKEGEVSNYIFFIEKGFIRCFYRNGKKETTVWFMSTNDIIVSVKSFYGRMLSYENIQAVEESLVHYIHYDQLQSLYDEFLEFNVLGRLLTIKYYMLSEERLYNIRNLKAEERYAYLLAQHPEICTRARVAHIASYLGIGVTTLSRIRAGMPVD